MTKVKSLAKSLMIVLVLGLLPFVVWTSGQPVDAPKVSTGDPILPHGLDATGKVALEPDIRAGDYARVLLGYAYFAEKAAAADKASTTKTLVDLWLGTSRIFLATDGKVVNRWDPDPAAGGRYVKEVGDPNIATQAIMAYAATYTHCTFRRGNLDAATYVVINPWLASHAITMAKYGMDQM